MLLCLRHAFSPPFPSFALSGGTPSKACRWLASLLGSTTAHLSNNGVTPEHWEPGSASHATPRLQCTPSWGCPDSPPPAAPSGLGGVGRVSPALPYTHHWPCIPTPLLVVALGWEEFSFWCRESLAWSGEKGAWRLGLGWGKSKT